MKTNTAATEYATITARMTVRLAQIDAATAAGQWDEVDRLTKLQSRDESKAVRLYRAIDDAARASRTAWTM